MKERMFAVVDDGTGDELRLVEVNIETPVDERHFDVVEGDNVVYYITDIDIKRFHDQIFPQSHERPTKPVEAVSKAYYDQFSSEVRPLETVSEAEYDQLTGGE